MQQQKELYKKHYAHAKLMFYFIIIKPICRSHWCCCRRCLLPLFFSFPAGSSLAQKIIPGDIYFYLSVALFFLSRCITLWLLVNTLVCTCTSGLSCQFAWVNKYWNYTTMVFSSSEVVSLAFYLKENNAWSLKSMAILLRILKINSHEELQKWVPW